jgi:predicted peptidase
MAHALHDVAPVQPVVSSKPPVTMVLKGVTTEVNNAIGGYYVATPSNYDSTSDRYPLLFFIHGGGQYGNGAVDLPSLLRDGPAQLVDEKRFPGTFTSGGKTYSFIVFNPQVRRYPGVEDLADCLEYVKKNFRIDTTRIYVAGLSIGGVETTNLAAFLTTKIAAISPMGGVFLDYASTNKASVLAAASIPIWAFHSENDPVINISDVRAFTAKVNSYSPKIPVRLTVWPSGGHDAWTRALDPTYKENGMNVYEWMLQYHR